MAVLVVVSRTDLGKDVRAAPAKERKNRQNKENIHTRLFLQ
jgi:hypothetical protein